MVGAAFGARSRRDAPETAAAFPPFPAAPCEAHRAQHGDDR